MVAHKVPAAFGSFPSGRAGKGNLTALFARNARMEVTASDDLREIFTTGLRNAHAMEKQALSIMEPQLQRLENYPEIGQRLEAHIRETNGQIERLDTILEELGESSSGLKDVAQSVAGSLAAMGHTMAGDKILKNSLANFAFENFGSRHIPRSSPWRRPAVSGTPRRLSLRASTRSRRWRNGSARIFPRRPFASFICAKPGHRRATDGHGARCLRRAPAPWRNPCTTRPCRF